MSASKWCRQGSREDLIYEIQSVGAFISSPLLLLPLEPLLRQLLQLPSISLNRCAQCSIAARSIGAFNCRSQSLSIADSEVLNRLLRRPHNVPISERQTAENKWGNFPFRSQTSGDSDPNPELHRCNADAMKFIMKLI